MGGARGTTIDDGTLTVVQNYRRGHVAERVIVNRVVLWFVSADRFVSLAAHSFHAPVLSAAQSPLKRSNRIGFRWDRGWRWTDNGRDRAECVDYYSERLLCFR